MTAVLTPSTKGLRKSLEDIVNFSMPLAPASQQAQLKKSDSSGDFASSSTTTTTTNEIASTGANESANSTSDSIVDSSICEPPVGDSIKDNDEYNNEGENRDKNEEESNDDDDDEEDEDEDHEEWLEKVGLNSKVVVTMQRNSKNAQKDSLFYFDNRPKSTLLFSESGDVQSLFNYLLNSKTCMLASGPLAGVPPTLLAPVPFVGATLQKLRLEQHVIKSVGIDGK